MTVRRKGLSLALAALVVAGLGGCASSPDWVKPWTWVGIGGRQAPKPEGAAQPYPNLADVPAKPKELTPEEVRKTLVQGLVSDRANARHTDETLRNPALPESTDPAPAEPRPAAKPEAKAAPAPTAPVPAAPVAQGGAAAPATPVAPVAPGASLASGGAVEVAFAPGSAKLAPDQAARLSTLASLQRESGARIGVVGHAGDDPVKAKDETARLMALFDLSLRRAQAVAAELQKLGVSASALQVEGKGAEEPAARAVTVSLR